MNNNDCQAEMPRYECHKIVWALQIKEIVFDAELATRDNRETDGSAMIYPVEHSYGPIKVDSDYLHKHREVMQPGNYYVVYKDGYKSCSPRESFEEGYTML